jgi:hypothetical protein
MGHLTSLDSETLLTILCDWDSNTSQMTEVGGGLILQFCSTFGLVIWACLSTSHPTYEHPAYVLKKRLCGWNPWHSCSAMDKILPVPPMHISTLSIHTSFSTLSTDRQQIPLIRPAPLMLVDTLSINAPFGLLPTIPPIGSSGEAFDTPFGILPPVPVCALYTIMPIDMFVDILNMAHSHLSVDFINMFTKICDMPFGILLIHISTDATIIPTPIVTSIKRPRHVSPNKSPLNSKHCTSFGQHLKASAAYYATTIELLRATPYDDISATILSRDPLATHLRACGNQHDSPVANSVSMADPVSMAVEQLEKTVSKRWL